ncbi:cation-translocating P-type ATPase [Massilimicrobiota timonensis]|uniref:cation-translocating P-type ATPase n=1 Tax=Massilimicrobiota timonensis TaxID=1776392 RepID=UPI0019614CBA|nr:cation-translocating P-type ATPase [Massilimicrobiota timonensis]MBM6965235.1 cation-translocating P-type ATPase [Massilimicrobiota timonensis]
MEQKREYGLTQQEVFERQQAGAVNQQQKTISKSYAQIFRENICTLFNLLNVLIAIALALVGAWSNLVFIVIIITNVCIGIIQEIHAKKLVDELSLLMIPHVKVLRDQKQQTIDVNEIVMDDVMVLEAGDQICCDSVVIDGEIEANESLLTGESDAIHKTIESSLLSGSSVISGKCYAQVIHVGDDNYTSRLTNEVKKAKELQSELLNSMRKVTKVTSFMIVPLGIILFLEAYFLRHDLLSEAVISSSAGLLGMLPKGLVLLMSVSLAAGVTKLAKQKILIQDIYSLETLAHVDTLCLDKTGTITNGKMKVEKVENLSTQPSQQFLDYFGSYLHYSDDNNATYQAICEDFTLNDHHLPSQKVAFSSQRKWSAMTFEGFGSIVMGAPERLMKELPASLMQQIESGKRVIIIAYTQNVVDAKKTLPDVTPTLAIILTDMIRKDVEKTLAYFDSQGVDVKIISGDHVLAVSKIAQMAGLKNYDRYIDMSEYPNGQSHMDELVNQYSVFGRVTPQQKKWLVEALKRQGHTVAMTGDGVNDMLALKEADCSIAIAEGSEAVKQLSQIVLLNSEFSCLPDVVLEGRRVVNNLTRVASVFFIKTIYSIILTIACAICNIPFPFIPIQITLIDFAIEAYPSFLTLLEPQTHKIKGKFLPTVFKNTIPHASGVLLCFLLIYTGRPLFHIPMEQSVTMMYLALACISMQAVIVSSFPMNKLRLFVCVTMVLGFILAIILFHQLLHLTMLTYAQMILTIIITCIGLLFKEVVRYIISLKTKDVK